MTAKWIQEAAEAATRAELGMADNEPNMATGETTRWVYQERRAAFIAGVELGIAKAAEVAQRNPGIEPGYATAHAQRIAAAILALGSDNEEE